MSTTVAFVTVARPTREDELVAHCREAVFFAGDPWLEDDVMGAVRNDLVVTLDDDASPTRVTFDITLGG